MLTPLEIYNKFQLKVNKNDTNSNIKVPKGQFIVLFNEQKRFWLNEKVKDKEDSDYIEDIEFLLETDKSLKKLSSYTLKDDFELPTNFFRRVSSYSTATKGICKDTLYNWFVKPKDINVLLQNQNQKPSFEYQETIALLNNDKVSIYKTDFTINEVFLTYYREPTDLDIEGYKYLDGTVSKNVQIDLDNKSIEEIINLTVAEALRNYESVEQLQIAIQRLQEQGKQ